ncbi:preprotein translocase subunit SecA, partial [Candidatus Poribacteria bacterium]|nr:preprotein translocase subunit SecA [Candidatus Poribacteria bacterium]
MFQSVLAKVFGTKHERDVKKLQPWVDQINALEPEMQKLSDAELKAKTDEFRERLDKGETLDDLMVEAYAVVREAAVRVLGQRHYDVQIMGAVVLHQGKIAEMKTGEGKTLTSTMPVYLNALTGKGVHVVTPNYYLAYRDSEWMGAVHRFLGLSVGLILHNMKVQNGKLVQGEMDIEEKKKSYNSDITYGVNDAFGFDYLRDNKAVIPEMRVQRELNYAIVDEVDFILIDEAKTPLIISDRPRKSADLYYKINRIIPRLNRDVDYQIDEKYSSKGTVTMTEEGIAHIERLLGVNNLYDPQNIGLVHHVEQALVAHTLYKRDIDYVVKDGQVIIVDEFTGRLQPGRRWSDGLHQAVEAKERVRIEE